MACIWIFQGYHWEGCQNSVLFLSGVCRKGRGCAIGSSAKARARSPIQKKCCVRVWLKDWEQRSSVFNQCGFYSDLPKSTATAALFFNIRWPCFFVENLLKNYTHWSKLFAVFLSLRGGFFLQIRLSINILYQQSTQQNCISYYYVFKKTGWQ